jgi:hypothetical protein
MGAGLGLCALCDSVVKKSAHKPVTNQMTGPVKVNFKHCFKMSDWNMKSVSQAKPFHFSRLKR